MQFSQLAAIALIVFINTIAVGQAQEPLDNEEEIINRAIRGGINFLARNQQKDGSIADRPVYVTGQTALSILAFLSDGVDQKGNTSEALALRRAIAFLLDEKQIDKDGYFGHTNGSGMYEHAIAMIALNEVHRRGINKTQDAVIEQRLKTGLDVILSAQRIDKLPQFKGGWRYSPKATDSDLSCTFWQIFALRTAEMNGLGVPKESFALAQSFVNNCRSKKPDLAGRAEGFQYQPGDERHTFGRAATGVFVNALLNRNETTIAAEDLDWLKVARDSANDFYRYYHFMLYGLLMNGADRQISGDGAEWVRKLVINEQLPSGSWKGSGGLEFKHEFCTAVCVLTLTAERRKLLCLKVLNQREKQP